MCANLQWPFQASFGHIYDIPIQHHNNRAAAAGGGHFQYFSSTRARLIDFVVHFHHVVRRVIIGSNPNTDSGLVDPFPHFTMILCAHWDERPSTTTHYESWRHSQQILNGLILVRNCWSIFTDCNYGTWWMVKDLLDCRGEWLMIFKVF